MKPLSAVNPVCPRALALVAAAALLSGCTSTSSDGGWFGSKVDYKSAASKTSQLEVPPDLTQLSRDSRYQPQGGVISALAAANNPGTVPTATGAPSGAPTASSTVAVTTRGEVKIERLGQQRWLAVTGQTPEQLWPQLRAFWTDRGFTLDLDDPQIGVMETNWNENRAKLPDDAVRNTIGRLLGNLYDTGERDRYRTRVERTATGSEIFVSHRGAAEVYANERRDITTWQGRASDPQLEAEFLSRMLVTLGTTSKEESAVSTAAAAANATPEAAPRARRLSSLPSAALEVDEPFDRAWRRVGLALDRSGFTVEDRDRAAGLYYVRYIDPKTAGQEEPGWWAKLFGNAANPQAAVRYRIAIQSAAEKSTILVQTSAGAPEAGENGQRIVGLLVNELR